MQYKSASGTTYLKHDLPATSIAAGGYFLITRPPGEYTGGLPGDSTQTVFLMGASGGHVFLADDNNNLTSCVDADIVDKIGYGTGDCPEASAAAAHAAGSSLERFPGSTNPVCGNGVDTNDNSLDFGILGTPDPRNSATVEHPCRDLGNVGVSLHLGHPTRDDLNWAAALGAATYKVRRATSRDFMQAAPIPDDTHLWSPTTTPAIGDATPPAPGTVFYYFVNAIDAAGSESDD